MKIPINNDDLALYYAPNQESFARGERSAASL